MSLDAPTPEPEWRVHWGRRLQEYLNATRRQIDSAIASLDSRLDIVEAGAVEAWTPVFSNVGVDTLLRTGLTAEINGMVYIFGEAVVNVVPTGFISVALPQLPHATVVGHEFGSIQWLVNDPGTGTSYTGYGFTDGSGNLSARMASAGGSNSAWQAGVPTTWATGFEITVSGWYPKA